MPMLSRSLLLRGHRLLLLLTQRRPEFCPPLRHALRLRASPDRGSLSLMTSATSPWHTRLRACARTFRELEPDEQSPQGCRGTEGNAHNLCIKCAWSFSKTRAIVAILRCMCSSRLVHLNRANTMFNWLCLGSSTTSVVFFVVVLWPRICITTGVARLADEIIYCTQLRYRVALVPRRATVGTVARNVTVMHFLPRYHASMGFLIIGPQTALVIVHCIGSLFSCVHGSSSASMYHRVTSRLTDSQRHVHCKTTGLPKLASWSWTSVPEHLA